MARAEGPTLVLRLIEPDDADYVHALRTNPAYNQYLSPVTGTAEDQRRWIESYKEREREGVEFYYVIERRDGIPCGVVRLYGITADSFTWGSWILDHNKPPKAALESALLVYSIAFDQLNIPTCHFDVRKDNASALRFHVRMGAIETARDEQDVFFTYTQVDYLSTRDDLLIALGREALDGR